MQSKIENVNKVYSLIPIVLGLGFAAMAYPLGLIQQEVYATFYGESHKDVMAIAYPSDLSEPKMTKQDNSTLSNQYKDNPTPIPFQVPNALPIK